MYSYSVCSNTWCLATRKSWLFSFGEISSPGVADFPTTRGERTRNRILQGARVTRSSTRVNSSRHSHPCDGARSWILAQQFHSGFTYHVVILTRQFLSTSPPPPDASERDSRNWSSSVCLDSRVTWSSFRDHLRGVFVDSAFRLPGFRYVEFYGYEGISISRS